MSFLNQLVDDVKQLNRKHQLLPFGQGRPPQPPAEGYYGHPLPQQYYPGQQPQPYPYQPQGHWQSPPPPQQVPPAPHEVHWSPAPLQHSASWHQAHPGPAPGNWGSPSPAHPGLQQQQQQPWPPTQQTPPVNYDTRPGGSGAPPVPSHSRPGGPIASLPSDINNPNNPSAARSPIYWRPIFKPEVPVDKEFDHRLGHGEPWGWGNNELQNYTAEKTNSFHTADGKLVVRAISLPIHPDPDARFTSARLVSKATLGRRDGCLTAWMTLPCAEGIWPAFWLLPREPFVWPHEGEIDIAESWNGDRENHSCLHWGFYNGEDAQKHLVRTTHIPDMPQRPVRFDFVWQCSTTGVRHDGKSEGGGRLVWYIDGRPVMRNVMPPGTRLIEDWVVLFNVAMGGNVCQGKQPRDGSYDMVIHGMQMSELPDGGWAKFDHDWEHCADGAVM
ncbi:concanavalin A-like lectin/glucanase domain-containing protein [Xylariaceae sp. FL0255]|nr:concanavalin A-like lectin/glucanase domain-containing protein [Xylariaceae sp. FL0255]